MSPCFHGSRSGSAEAAGFEGPGHRCHGRAPWPVAAAAVGGAFWLFPPLGIAGLAYLALRRRHGDGGPAWGGRGPRGFGGRGRRFWSSGNAAFDEARAEAWQRIEEEASAFDDFRRREAMTRDREVYDRFRSERAAAPTSGETPKAGESSDPASGPAA